MTFLLDVNVLIALIDPTHLSHDAAHGWFQNGGGENWATCPITENGVIRIVSHPKYANSPGAPSVVAEVLARFRQRHGHVFWPDDISLLDSTHVDITRLLTHGQLTDSYLLALASARGGRLASFDQRLSVVAVRRGKEGLHLIGKTQ